MTDDIQRITVFPPGPAPDNAAFHCPDCGLDFNAAPPMCLIDGAGNPESPPTVPCPRCNSDVPAPRLIPVEHSSMYVGLGFDFKPFVEQVVAMIQSGKTADQIADTIEDQAPQFSELATWFRDHPMIQNVAAGLLVGILLMVLQLFVDPKTGAPAQPTQEQITNVIVPQVNVYQFGGTPDNDQPTENPQGKPSIARPEDPRP